MLRPKQGGKVGIAGNNLRRTKRAHAFGLCIRRHRNDFGSAPFCKLNCGRANAARCPGNENTLASLHIDPRQDVFGGAISTRKTCQFNVGKLRFNAVCMHCRDAGVICKPAIDFRTEIQNVETARPVKDRFDQYPLTYTRGIYILANCHNMPAGVCTLYTREMKSRA